MDIHMSPTSMSGTSPTKYIPHIYEETLICDIVCQAITLQNIPTGQAISLLMTHYICG